MMETRELAGRLAELRIHVINEGPLNREASVALLRLAEMVQMYLIVLDGMGVANSDGLRSGLKALADQLEARPGQVDAPPGPE